jgi:membrane-bound ClpP family serine protease
MHDLGLVSLALILLGVLIVVLSGGVWISVALGLIGFIAMLLTTSVPIGSVLATTVWSASASWTLAALPLFIWMGEILFRTSSLLKNPRHSENMMIQFSITNHRRLACGEHLRIRAGCFLTYRRRRGFRQAIR